MAYVSSQGTKRTIQIDPVDFLEEGIDEFLQSGAKPVKLASAVVKLMAATELLLKEELERICPALVLDKVDDDGLQVAKAFGLAKELINPKQLESVELKTAPFPKLLNRATKFIDLKEARPSLEKLYKIRNALVSSLRPGRSGSQSIADQGGPSLTRITNPRQQKI